MMLLFILGFQDTDASWETVVEPIELVSHRLDYGWGIVTHMNGVCNSDALRQAHQEVQSF